MSGKLVTTAAERRVHGEMRAELRRDLEARGVSSEIAERVATDLAELAHSLSPEARRGVLTGAALASAAHGQRVEALRRSQQDLAEIERLMASFALELQKVDEAVKLLATFVTRVREQSAPAPAPRRIVH